MALRYKDRLAQLAADKAAGNGAAGKAAAPISHAPLDLANMAAFIQKGNQGGAKPISHAPLDLFYMANTIQNGKEKDTPDTSPDAKTGASAFYDPTAKETTAAAPAATSGNGGVNLNFNLPEYASKYSGAINALLGELGEGYSGFTGGREYEALKDRYSSLGKRAMQDTLGQVAGRTGGIASSYATGAAAQQYNNYMSALESAALEMYQGEASRKTSQLSALAGLESSDYNDYLSTLGMIQQLASGGLGEGSTLADYLGLLGLFGGSLSGVAAAGNGEVSGGTATDTERNTYNPYDETYFMELEDENLYGDTKQHPYDETYFMELEDENIDGDTGNRNDYELTNTKNGNFVYVNGYGFIPWQMLDTYIRGGKIREVFDDKAGTVSYVPA